MPRRAILARDLRVQYVEAICHEFGHDDYRPSLLHIQEIKNTLLLNTVFSIREHFSMLISWPLSVQS